MFPDPTTAMRLVARPASENPMSQAATRGLLLLPSLLLPGMRVGESGIPVRNSGNRSEDREEGSLLQSSPGEGDGPARSSDYDQSAPRPRPIRNSAFDFVFLMRSSSVSIASMSFMSAST